MDIPFCLVLTEIEINKLDFYKVQNNKKGLEDSDCVHTCTPYSITSYTRLLLVRSALCKTFAYPDHSIIHQLISTVLCNRYMY